MGAKLNIFHFLSCVSEISVLSEKNDLTVTSMRWSKVVQIPTTIEPKKLGPEIYFYISDTVQSSLVICICVFVCTLI